MKYSATVLLKNKKHETQKYLINRKQIKMEVSQQKKTVYGIFQGTVRRKRHKPKENGKRKEQTKNRYGQITLEEIREAPGRKYYDNNIESTLGQRPRKLNHMKQDTGEWKKWKYQNCAMTKILL